MKEIGSGAEAIVYQNNDKIIKERPVKRYRHPEIDKKLRSARTRREAKILEKLEEIHFPAPKLISNDRKKTVIMEEIKGEKLRNCLENSEPKKLAKEIGKLIAILHNNSIIHGDLTTSNMILAKRLYFIDFGLSTFSEKIEDMAVDLHILSQSMEAGHNKLFDDIIGIILKSYKSNSQKGDLVIKRFNIVESRGRNKGKN